MDTSTVSVPDGFSLDTNQSTTPQAQSNGVPDGFTIDSNNQEQLPPDQPDFANIGTSPQAQPQQKSPINFGDMLRMAALNSPQEQQTYLKSKFKFAEPNQDGSFNVGNDPTNLTPIHTGSMGDVALNVLAKGAAMIPAIAGQMRGAITGAEMGTAIEPGAGTLLGGLIGAGAGAMTGEGAKNLASSTTAGYDPEKAATDNVISGLFGSGGQALGNAIKFGAKNFIAPKVAAAMDGAINSSDQPDKSGAFLSKVLKFTANVDEKESMKGSQLGWKNISDNHANWNPDEIDNIAQGITQDFNKTKGLAQVNLSRAEESLLRTNPNASVSTGDMMEKMTDQFGENGLNILNKTESSLEGMGSAFRFRDDIPRDVKSALPDVMTFFKRLGAITTDGGKTFHIPENATTNLSDAMSAKKLFQGTFNNPNFNQSVANVMKQGLYGEGASPLYPNGFGGLRMAINDTAKATGNDAYIIANKNFSDMMKASEGQLADNNGNKFNVPGWMDVENPASVAKYLKNVNKLDAFGNQALDNLHNQIGGDFKTKASQWAVAQAVSKASPQILRLGVVGGLLGLAMPGSPAERAARVPMAFALGSPTGVKVMTRMAETGGELSSAGGRILSAFGKSTTRPSGKAVLSQLLSKKVRR